MINIGPPTEHCLYVNDSQYDDLIHDTLVLIHFKNRHEPVQFFKIELVQKVVLGLFFAFFSCFICATERMSIICHSISLKLGGQKQPATLHLSLNTT